MPDLLQMKTRLFLIRLNELLDTVVGFDADNISEELSSKRETIRFEETAEWMCYRWTVDAKPRGVHIHLLGKFLGYFVRRFYEQTIIKSLRQALET